MTCDINLNLSQLAEYAGVLLTLSGGMALLWRPIKKVLGRYDEALKRAEDQLAQHATLIQKQEEINARQDECNAEVVQAIKPLKKGVQQILRFRLQRECERINRKREITSKEWTDLYHLHEAYDGLGQNGLITSCYREAISQPRKDE